MAVKDYAKCHHNVLRLFTLPLQQINVPMIRFLSVLFEHCFGLVLLSWHVTAQPCWPKGLLTRCDHHCRVSYIVLAVAGFTLP